MVATLENIRLTKLKEAIMADMNMSGVFGLADEPIIEKVTLAVELGAEGSSNNREGLSRLIKLAEDRCPVRSREERNSKSS
ncbi:MAG: hypothetical protein M1368_00535 [Thaumarchaeota archaeon]|nr:hypothetical protein [Nitrososphaerota archaeon]